MNIIKTIKSMIDEIEEPSEIMVLSRYISDALKNLGVSKSRGSNIGEYAEYLAASAFDGVRMSNAKEGHDLTLPCGEKIEVKGRIFEGKRVPMTYIRHSTIASNTFDSLMYIVFDEDMNVKYAMKISHSNFQKIAKYVEPISAPPKWVFVAKQSLISSPYVIDITVEIKLIALKLKAES